MRRIASGVLALAAFLAMLLFAASRPTVRQLAEILTSAHTSRLLDDDIAQRIARVELSERITDATLSSLSRDQGESTKVALRILADESAFLDPPASELPTGGPPAVDEQRAIAARAFDYAHAYIGNLPNFTCTQITRRIDDGPSTVRGKEAVTLGRLHLRDSIVSELAFNNGAESRQVRTVNGLPWNNKAPLAGLTTYGEFGSILASPFGPGKAKWSHWETIDGKRVAVFGYSIDRAHSNFSLTWCCTVERKSPWRETVATQGELFIEPASGSILRVTRRAADIPDGFPMRRSDTVVEYRAVDIGGKSWMCPVRSISISDNLTPEQPIARGPGGIGLHVYELNEVEYTDYHKFGSESRLMADEAPPEDQPGTVPAEPQPAQSAPLANDAATEAAVAQASGEATPVATAPAAAPPPLSSAPPLEAPAAKAAGTAPQDQPVTFQSKVNLVLIPVVVRDVDGHAVSDLRQDAFTLFDNGKRRDIVSFAAERAGQNVAVERPVAGANGRNEASHGEKAVSASMVIPDHFIAYLFDDMAIADFSDLVWVRKGAIQHIDELLPGDRAAVFTTSCRTGLDFTDDRAKLREAVSKLPFRPFVSSCGGPGVPGLEGAGGGHALTAPEAVQLALTGSLGGVVRRMSTLPGQRSIVFISYGMALSPRILRDLTDYALRYRVVIHTLNAYAVHPTAPGADVAKDPKMAEFGAGQVWSRILAMQGLRELAHATGGTAVEGTNDAKGAYRKLATPEWVYMLGVTPGEAVVDKKTHEVKAHELKVKLTDQRKLSVQARQSYYPPAPAGEQGAPAGSSNRH